MARDGGLPSDLKLIDTLTRRAILRGAALDEGDAGLANGYFDEMVKAGLELLRRDHSSRGLIVSLLGHEAADVRMAAALFCLEFDPKRSLPVLKKLEETQTRWRKVSAAMTIRLWEEGTLKLLSEGVNLSSQMNRGG